MRNKPYYVTLTHLLLGLNFCSLTVVCIVKTQMTGDIDWFTGISWPSVVNIFIDIAVESNVSSVLIIALWFLVSVIWSGLAVYNFSQQRKKLQMSREEEEIYSARAIDIDELSQPADKKEMENPASPESAGATFAATLSQAFLTDETSSPKAGGSNEVLSSIPPEVAEQFKALQRMLERLEADKDSNYSKKFSKD